MSLRSFVALEVSPKLASMLSTCSDELRALDRSQEIRWTPPENYHLTLEFLGDIEFASVHKLGNALQARLQDLELPSLVVNEISYFPFNAKPKVVAALLAKHEQLIYLHQQVQKAIRNVGLVPEKRRFTPHVTIGRVRARRTPRLQIRPLSLDFLSEFNALILYESQLHQSGAVYSPLFELPLARSTGTSVAMESSLGIL